MKKILSVALSTAMAFSMFASVAFGADAKLTPEQQFEALKGAGIVEGYKDGTAGLEKFITRAELAKVIVKSIGLEEVTGVASYNDKNYTASHWAAPYIEAATKEGILEGKDAVKKLFDPTGNVTVQELAKVLKIALDLEVPADATNTASDWAKGFVAAAVKGGYIAEGINYQANATRSQVIVAAHAIYEAKNLKVTKAEASDSTHVKLTLSNGEVVDLVLEKALEANKATELTYTTADGKELKYSVTWVVTDATKVDKAVSTNLKEVEVVFDGKVDKATATDKDNYSIDKGNKAIKSVSLLEDGVTARVLIEGTFVQQQNYTITVKNVKSGSNVINATDVKFSPIDNTLPKVEEVKALGNKAIKVTFNKPVKTVTSSNFKLDDQAFYGSVTKSVNEREVVIKSYAGNFSIGEHKLTVGLVEDYVPLKSLSDTYEVSVKEDKEAPAVTEITATLEKVKVTFNKDIDPDSVKAESFYWLSGTSKKTGVITQLSGTEFEIDFNAKGNRLPGYETTLNIDVKDYSGNVIAVKEHKVTASVDLVRPKVVEVTQANDKKSIAVKFDKAVDGKDRANYVVKKGDKVIPVYSATEAPGSNGKVWNVNFYNTLESGDYNLSVTGIKDKTALSNVVVDYNAAFTITDTANPQVSGFVDANNYNRTVAIAFDKQIDLSTLGNRDKYFVEFNDGSGFAPISLPSDVVIEAANNGKSVRLIFPEFIGNTRVTFPTATSAGSVRTVSAVGLKSINGVVLNGYVDKQAISVANTAVKSVKRDGYKKIEVTFDKAIAGANRGDFIVTNGLNGPTIAIDSVDVDGTKVTINTANDISGVQATYVTVVSPSGILTLAGNTAAGSTTVANQNVAPKVSWKTEDLLTLKNSEVTLPFTIALKKNDPTPGVKTIEDRYADDLIITKLGANNERVRVTDFTTKVNTSDSSKIDIEFGDKYYSYDYTIQVRKDAGYIQSENGVLALESDVYTTTDNINSVKPVVTVGNIQDNVPTITGTAPEGTEVTVKNVTKETVVGIVKADASNTFTVNVAANAISAGDKITVTGVKNNAVSVPVTRYVIDAAAAPALSNAVYTEIAATTTTAATYQLTVNVSKPLTQGLTNITGLTVEKADGTSVGVPGVYNASNDTITITFATGGNVVSGDQLVYSSTGNVAEGTKKAASAILPITIIKK